LPSAEPKLVDLVYEDSGYQTELPGAEPRAGTDASWRPSGKALPYPVQGKREPVVVRGSEAAVLLILLLVLGIAGLAILVFFVLREVDWLWPRARRAGAESAAVPPEPEVEAEEPLPDVAALVAEGRFSDAVHALLLHAQALLAKKLERAFPVALTSREILHGTELPDAGKSALASIVTEVERSRFGGDAVDRDDYERCQGEYDVLFRRART
jgi:hypothetical protein